MSKSVDERVLSMQFDNKQFESGVQTSLGTLDKLNKSLKLTEGGKGLENVGKAAKNVDMSGLSNGIENVKAKFSMLDVVGVTALANITNSAVNAGKNIVKSLTIGPISDGYKEYEMTLNAVQTTMAGTGKTAEEVEKQLKRLDKYADETVYSSADMFNNLPKFTNAGVELEKATTAMIGIANATALAGGDATKASIAFYNLGQSIGTGYLTRMDYNSINNAGIATMEWKNQMVAAAIAQGKLTKAGEDAYVVGNKTFTLQSLFIDGLQEQWASADVLMEVFEDYGDTTTEIGNKAQASAQNVKHFTMMMESLKATAGTGWKDTWQTIFGGLDEATKFWTGITNFISDIITKISDVRNNFLDKVLNKGLHSFVNSKDWTQLAKNGQITKGFKDALIETAESHGISVKKMIKNNGGFVKSLKEGWLTTDILNETLKKTTKSTKEVVKENTKTLEDFQKVVNDVIRGDYGNGEDRVKALTAAAWDYHTVQSLVNKVWYGGKIELSDLNEETLKTIGCTEEEIQVFKELAKAAEETGTPLNKLMEDMNQPTGRELIIDTFSNFAKSLKRIAGAIKSAWSGVFSNVDVAGGIRNFLKGFNDVSKHMVISKENAKNLQDTFSGLFSVIKLVSLVLGGALKIAFTIFGEILKACNLDFLEFTAIIGRAITKVTDWITTNNFLVKGISKLIVFTKEWLSEFIKLPEIQNGIKTLKEKFTTAFGVIKDRLTETTKRAKEWLLTFREAENVQKAFIKVQSALKTAFEFVGERIVKAVRNIRDWIAAVKESENVQKVLSEFAEFFSKAFDEIKRVFKDGGEAIGKLIENLKNLDKMTLPNITKTLKDFGINLAACLDPDKLNLNKEDLPKVIQNLGKNISNVMDTVKETLFGSFDVIGDGLSKFFGMLKEKLSSKYLLGNLLAVAYSAVLIKLVNNLGNFVTSLTKVTDSIASVVINFANVLDSVRNAVNAFALKTRAEAIMTIAKAIAILAASIVVLAQLDRADLWNAVGAVAALAAVLVLLSLAMSFVKKIGISSAAVLALGTSLLLLAIAMKVLADIPAKQAMFNAIILSALMVVLAGIAKYLSKDAIKLKTGAGFLIAFAASIFILAKALEAIGKLSFGKMVGSLIVLLGAILLMSKIMEACKNVDFRGAVGLLGMAIALRILVGAIQGIADIKTKDLIKGLVGIAAVLGMFAVVMLVTKFAGKYAAQGGFAIILISAALFLIVKVLKQLADLDKSTITKAMDSLTSIMGVFALIIAVSFFAGKYAVRAGVMLLTMAGAIAILSLSMILLSSIEPEGLKRATKAIVALIVAFSLVVAASNLAKGNIKQLTIITTAIGILVGALVVLSMIDPKGLKRAAAALTSVIGVFALLTFATKYAGKAYGTVILLTVVVVALAGVLYILAQLPTKAALQASIALSVLLLSMSAAIAILGFMKPTAIEGIGALAILTIIVGVLAQIIAKLASIKNADKVLPIATGLSRLILALSASCLLLGAIGFIGPAAFIGLGVLAALVAGMTIILVALGKLSQHFESMGPAIEEGIKVLGRIGYALGNFFGNIVGGFSAGVTSGLPTIGENLSLFMENASVFFEGMKSVNEESLTGVKNLAKMFALLAGANILESVGKFLNGGKGSIETFSEQLPIFADTIVAFSQKISGKVDEDAITGAANAGKLLAEMVSLLPKLGGVAELLVGVPDLNWFGNQICAFGSAIVRFSQIPGISTINEATVTGVATAGKVMAELINAVPKIGGIAQAFTGVPDLNWFGNQICAFGSAIVRFSQIPGISTINEATVTGVATAGKVMAELTKAVPKVGGIVQAFTGVKDLSKFGSNIVSFGQSMVAFSKIEGIGDISESTVTGVAAAGKVMTTLNEAIPDATVWEKFNIADSDMENFGDSINSFGKSMVKFSEKIADFDGGNIQKVVGAVNKLININNRIAETDTSKISSFIKNIKKLGDIKIDTTTLSTSASSIKESISNIMAAVATTVSSNNGKISAAMRSAMSGMVAAINSRRGTVVASMNSVVAAAANTIKAGTGKMRTAGVALVTALVNGIKSGKGVKPACTSLVSNAAQAIRDKRSAFKSAGGYLVEGLTAGLNNAEKRSAAISAGRSLGAAVAKAVKEGAGVQSPSKITISVGKFLGEGLVVGIKLIASKVYKSGYNLGQTAANTVSKAVSGIARAVESDTNIEPRIRPVVDLSNMNYVSDGINLGANIDASLSRPVTSLSGIVSSAQAKIDASNEKVISAVKGLREDLNNIYEADDTEIALYVDSRKMASSIAKPMNQQLNILAKRGAY